MNPFSHLIRSGRYTCISGNAGGTDTRLFISHRRQRVFDGPT